MPPLANPRTVDALYNALCHYAQALVMELDDPSDLDQYPYVCWVFALADYIKDAGKYAVSLSGLSVDDIARVDVESVLLDAGPDGGVHEDTGEWVEVPGRSYLEVLALVRAETIFA